MLWQFADLRDFTPNGESRDKERLDLTNVLNFTHPI